MTALQHKTPDRVPFFYRDVPEVEQRLLKDLNLNTRDKLLEHLQIDFRWVGPRYVGAPLFDKENNIKKDIWGVEYRYVRFSEAAGYWEPIQRPLLHVNDPAALNDYPWPKLEWFDFTDLAQQCERYSDYAIMTAPGYSSPGIFQCPIQILIGEERSFTDLALNPDFIAAMIDKVLAFQVPFIEKMFQSAAGGIDFFRIGNDFGTQNNLIVSLQMWKEIIQPALKSMADTAKKFGAYYYQHSCGAIRDLIPAFIETGVDVLDPVQVKAKGMVPAELRSEYGDRLCFSGGVDEQEILPSGDTPKVREAVFELLDAMAGDGGFFIGPTHNFQADIPTENILAMYEAAADWSSTH